MSRIGGAIRDTIATGNDAPRVSTLERGRPSFLVLLNARASNPGHSYLRLLQRKCLLPSAPRVRLRTLNRTSYESRNAMTNVPTAARAASALRNFSIWDLRSSRRPPAHGMRRKDILLRALALTAGKRNICKHLFDIHTLDHTSGGAPAALSKKNGADSSAESAPKREWQSKNVDGREKCPQVSWPSHPTCQRDG